MPPRFRRATMASFVVGLMAVATSLGSSASAPPSPRAPVMLSGAACAWLQQNKALAGFTCPKMPPLDSDIAAAPQSPGSAGTRQATFSPSTSPSSTTGSGASAAKFGPNVDATDPSEDVASGQSETAVAASGQFVVSAFNDATGFFFADPTNPKADLTGAGFSSDGGKSFSEVALPNSNSCQRIFGDPSVVSLSSGGATFFYVFSLYLPRCSTGGFEISLSVGTIPAGSTAIAFGQPIVVANGGSPGLATTVFLDKDFAAIDRVNKKIAVSYTAFGSASVNRSGQINIALCDLSATPGTPACFPGTGGPSYLTLANSPTTLFEELEGAYPAFSNAGDLYVTWNQNWFTNFLQAFFFGTTDPFTHQLAARVPAACLTFPTTGCATPAAVTVEQSVKSLDSLIIPGYNRGIGNDFPRIAFNNVTNQVVFVWNEGNAHPMGDIVLATADPTLATISPKVRVNDDNSFALHFLPAVSIDGLGNTNISWFDRRSAGGTSMTDVFAVSIPPGASGATNARVTSVATDWNSTGSFIAPNFGDYTDNTSDGTTFYVNWSDGRLGIPNSFVASATT